ncbi:hypothetical protein ALC56_00019, partial [Trachymyrmex septentrionalis]
FRLALRTPRNDMPFIRATCDSAKQRRIEQNRHGHRRWSSAERAESKKEEGRKEGR